MENLAFPVRLAGFVDKRATDLVQKTPYVAEEADTEFTVTTRSVQLPTEDSLQFNDKLARVTELRANKLFYRDYSPWSDKRICLQAIVCVSNTSKAQSRPENLAPLPQMPIQAETGEFLMEFL